MSSAKFAPMTANLLARKGDAVPSLATLPVRPSAFVNGHAALPPAARPPEERTRPAPASREADAAKPADENHDRPRRIMVVVTGEEFEKLGIAAVKKDQSRQQIVRAALDAYFQQLATELPRKCACMEGGPCCS